MNTPPCRQCRARKVRCDRRGISCGPCTRLAVACSYGGNDPVNTPTSTSTIVSVSPSDNYTEAGLRRRRSRRACAVCRRAKAKCAGGAPCARCGAHGLPCDGAGVTGPATATLSTTVSTTVPALSSVSPTLLSPSKSTSFSALDTTTLRACVDAYFAAPGSGPAFPFLLKAAVLADWAAGRLHPLLLQCIAASGACILGGQARRAAARDWMDAARRELLWHQLGRRPSLALVQALVLLARFEQGGAWGNAIVLWNLLALAARFAFSLGLHHEQGPDMDPVVQETRRRTVWAIYALDRLVCGGVDDLAVCPAERMRIRLPCSEQAFSRGEVSRAGFLSPGDDSDDDNANDPDNTPSPGEDFLAYYLRLLGHRHAILRYTKRLCFRNADPAAAAPAREALAAGLDAFVAAMSPALRVPTPQRLHLLAHASDASWFLELHTLLLQCRVDLNRHAVPGLREALPPATLAQCPVEYTTACRRDCLAAATGLCDLWAAASDTPGFPAVATASRSFFAFCFYHVARILLHLRSALVAPADEAAKLRRALVLIEGNNDNVDTGETAPSKYVRDTRALITVLAYGNPEAVARYVRGDKPITQRYMPSRHSLLEKVSGEGPEGPEPDGPEGPEPDGPEGPASLSDERLAPVYDWSVPALPLPDNLPGLPSLPWDLNDYYDPYLGDILLSMGV